MINILSIFIIIILISGCSSELSGPEQEVVELNREILQLENQIYNSNNKLTDYNTLIRNLNKLLSTVYYGSAKPIDGGKENEFTAFSMFYNENFYLITAGRCIEYEDIKYIDFKFKPNDSDLWIYPELVYYESNNNNNNDFAIFIYPYIRKGLIIEQQDKEPKYVLGNINSKINLFKEYREITEDESGSPILSSGCKLIGIAIENNFDYILIRVVTDAIDKYIDSNPKE